MCFEQIPHFAVIIFIMIILILCSIIVKCYSAYLKIIKIGDSQLPVRSCGIRRKTMEAKTREPETAGKVNDKEVPWWQRYRKENIVAIDVEAVAVIQPFRQRAYRNEAATVSI